MATNAEMWALVVGFLMPPLIAIIQQPGWPVWLRSVITFVASLAVAAVTVYVQANEWDTQDWMATALTILVTAIATYHGFWKTTGIAAKVENITSPGVNEQAKPGSGLP